MSQAIDNYVEAVRVSYDAIDEATGALEKSGAGITDDILFLKEQIDFLQNSPGPISSDDQTKLDAAQARTNALVARLQGFKQALETLDAATSRPATPPPVEPPAE